MARCVQSLRGSGGGSGGLVPVVRLAENALDGKGAGGGLGRGGGLGFAGLASRLLALPLGRRGCAARLREGGDLRVQWQRARLVQGELGAEG